MVGVEERLCSRSGARGAWECVVHQQQLGHHLIDRAVQQRLEVVHLDGDRTVDRELADSTLTSSDGNSAHFDSSASFVSWVGAQLHPARWS